MRGGVGVAVLVHVGEQLQQEVLEPERVAAEADQLGVDGVVNETTAESGVSDALLHGHAGVDDIGVDGVLLLADDAATQVVDQDVVSALLVQRERLRLSAPPLRYAELRLTVEQEEEEEEVPEQRAHERRALGVSGATQTHVVLLGLVETQDEDPLEAVGDEALVALVDHAAEVPDAIADVLRDEGGLHDELEDDPDGERDAAPVVEDEGGVQREERGVAKIEQHE